MDLLRNLEPEASALRKRLKIMLHPGPWATPGTTRRLEWRAAPAVTRSESPEVATARPDWQAVSAAGLASSIRPHPNPCQGPRGAASWLFGGRGSMPAPLPRLRRRGVGWAAIQRGAEHCCQSGCLVEQRLEPDLAHAPAGVPASQMMRRRCGWVPYRRGTGEAAQGLRWRDGRRRTGARRSDPKARRQCPGVGAITCAKRYGADGGPGGFADGVHAAAPWRGRRFRCRWTNCVPTTHVPSLELPGRC